MHAPICTKPLRLVSEQVEPTMELIRLHLISRVEAARASGCDARLLNECNHLWEGVRAISMVAICVRGDYSNSDCLHFSIAASNELGKIAKYIEDLLGFNPYDAWK